MWSEVDLAWAWVRARLVRVRKDEAGATAVEWLLIIIATIAIAGLAIAAVRAYVLKQSSKLN